MSALLRPASASAPIATSACSWATDLSGAFRVGCSKAPATYALPLMLIVSSPPHDHLGPPPKKADRRVVRVLSKPAWYRTALGSQARLRAQPQRRCPAGIQGI